MQQFKFDSPAYWTGACLIDPEGTIYPCDICGHEITARKYAGLSAWTICLTGWIRIGLSYVEMRKDPTAKQVDALVYLHEQACRKPHLIFIHPECIERALTGERGEIMEEEDDEIRNYYNCRV